ncbi:MAG: NAD(P)-dependent oxidoreductase, partial [Verrucomicrobiota bacterium]
EDFARDIGVELVPLETLFTDSDYISLHIPENDKTRGMINRDLLGVMKDGATLINCARSGVIDEDDLRAIKSEKTLHFLNDVYPKDAAGEKTVEDIADIMVPHLGASTREANANAASYAANQLIGLDDRGITSAVVNRDTPAGLDPIYYDLAYTLTKFCRGGFGDDAQLNEVETSVYGSLKEFSKWLVVPVVCALDEGAIRSLDHKAAEDRLATKGINYTCREVDEQKGYGNSITIDLTTHGKGQTLHKASVRGTVAEGNLMISRINDFDKLYVEPSGHMVCFIYKDRPGVLAQITSHLGESGINIDDVRNPHDESGDNSIALLKVAQEVPKALIDTIAEQIDAQIGFYISL